MRLDALPPQITGFSGPREVPAGLLDPLAFERACRIVAERHRGLVEGMDTDLQGKNYYGLTIRSRTYDVSVVANSRYPFIAFVHPGAFGLGQPELAFIDPESLADIFTAMTAFQPLDCDWLMMEPGPELLSNLVPAEIEQVKYWKPRTIGAVIFNWWD